MYSVFYNEIDPFAAEWIRKLIEHGIIAPGVVDERSIEDIKPVELMGYTQCHFFAGIGVWSYALRRAGWPDDRPVWTGSCPCQPFSAAGKKGGFTDERHLWPAWFHLISQCKPVKIFGEQVASKDGLAWFDLVQTDLEGTGYAVGKKDLCAAGFGAPHTRQRLYFVADSGEAERGRRGKSKRGQQWRFLHASNGGKSGSMGNASGGEQWRSRESREKRGVKWEDRGSGATGELANTGEHGHEGRLQGGQNEKREVVYRQAGCNGPANGFWGNAVWLPYKDGKLRAAEPIPAPMADGIAGDLGLVRYGDSEVFFPLVTETKNRVNRIKGYGNAIVAQVAIEWITAFMAEI